MADENREDRPRKVVMGTGNLLMGDDGVGIHVIQALRMEEGLPDDVTVIDAGTAALDVLQSMGAVESLIIVDAVKGGGEPGTIYRFSPEDIAEIPRERISLHQMSLLQTLKTAEMLGAERPNITIIGIEPGVISPGTSLSPPVLRTIPKIIEQVLSLI